jgi:hypothetical protein
MTAKILDIADFVADKCIVTAVDVAKEFGLSLDAASALMESLPFDTEEGLGTYSLKSTVDDFISEVDCDELVSNRVSALGLRLDGDFRRKIVEGMVDIHEKLLSIEEKVDEMAKGKTRPGVRRRRRGELLQPTPGDTPELLEIRREAGAEIAKAHATGDRKVYQTTYQRWYQRVKSAERRAGIGVEAEAEPGNASINSAECEKTDSAISAG